MNGSLGVVAMTNAQAAIQAAVARPTYGAHHRRDDLVEVLASADAILAWLDRQDRGVQDT